MIEKDVNSEIKTVLLKRQFKTNFIKQSLVLLTLGFVLVSSFFSVIPDVFAQSDSLRCEKASNASVVEADKSSIYLDEDIRIYARNPISNTAQCKSQEGNILHYYSFTDTENFNNVYPDYAPGTVFVARWDTATDSAFESGQKFPGSFVAKSAENPTLKSRKVTIKVFSYISGAESSKTVLTGTVNVNVVLEKQGDRADHAATTVKVVDSPQYVKGEVKTYKFTDPEMALNISANTSYRLSLEEANQGGKFVRIYYSLAWVNTGNHPKFGIDKYDASALAGTNPTMRGVYLGINYDIPSIPQCGKYEFPLGIELNCSEGNLADKLSYDVFNALPTPESFIGLPWDGFLVNDFTSVGETSQTKGYRIFPIFDMNWGFYGHDINSTNNPLKIDITVYKTTQAMLDACIKEQTDSGVTPEQAAENCKDDKTLHTGLAKGSSDTTPKDTADTATPIADFLAMIIGTIIKAIQAGIFAIFSFVVLPIIETLLAIPTYTDNFAAVILPGWELLRNLSNIFFILVLLVIGLGTLFRVQGYQYKNLLLKLIFAAFMVNFSMILTQSFLAIAETAQFQFLPTSEEKNPITGEVQTGTIMKSIAAQLMIAPINQQDLTPDEASKNLTEGLAQLIFPFFYLSLTLMAFVVFCSLAFFLILRMIVIWILLMTSPIAIVGMVIPQTQGYSKKWFSYLVQYGFFVTILGFFLNVTAYLAQRQGGVLKSLYASGQTLSFANFLSIIATNLFVMGFLIAGLKIAASTKVIGAKALDKFATKAGKLPFDFLKFAGERTFEGAQSLAGVTVDPRIWKKDWDNYLKRRDKEKEDRLKDRRLGKTGMGRLVPGRVGLGSPEQLYENFLTTDGWKKILLTPNQIFNRQQAKVRAGAAGMMTDEDRLKEKQDSDKAKLSRDAARVLRKNDELTGKTSEAEKLAKGLVSKEDELRKRSAELLEEAVLTTDPIERDRLNTEAGDLENQANQLKAKAEEIGLLEGSKGLDEISDGLSDANKEVFKKLADDIKNGLEESEKAYEKTMKDIEDKGLKDDKLRGSHGFSKFDPDGKDKPGYREVSADAKKAIAEKAAAFGEKADNLRFKSLINEAKDKIAKKGEINKEYDEQGVETGEDISYELRKEMKNGGKDKKERIEVLLERAAKIGALPEALQAISKVSRGTSYQDFVDTMKDLKVQAGFSDKDILKLAYAIGKPSKANKDFAFAFAVQRVGGDLGWRDEGSHNKEVAKGVARLTNVEFLKMADSSLFKTSAKDSSGKSTKELTEETIKRINGIPVSEAKSLESRLSPEVAHNVLNATNASKINFKSGKVNNRNVNIREIFESKAKLHA